MTPICVAIADLHLWHKPPVCRKDVDTYLQNIRTKLIYISNRALAMQVPVVIAGDIFHHWNPQPEVLSLFMEAFRPNHREGVVAIPGQHDLINHSLSFASLQKTGFYTLLKSGIITNTLHSDSVHVCNMRNAVTFVLVPFGRAIPDSIDHMYHQENVIIVAHQPVWHGKETYPGMTKDQNALKMLKDYPYAKAIITGDNHLPCLVSKQRRLLVNCGSLSRMTADQKGYKPCCTVILLHEGSFVAKTEALPIQKGVVSSQHIEEEQEDDERLNAFVAKLKEAKNASIDFEKNMEIFMNTNKLTEAVRKCILEAMAV